MRASHKTTAAGKIPRKNTPKIASRVEIGCEAVRGSRRPFLILEILAEVAGLTQNHCGE